jgi:hypothetical protein
MNPFQFRRRNRRLSFRRAPKPGLHLACWAGAPGQGLDLALSLVDASQVGIRCLLTGRLDQGQEVTLRLEGPRSTRPLERQGTVIWCEPAEGGFRVGIRLHKRLSFTELCELTHLHV